MNNSTLSPRGRYGATSANQSPSQSSSSSPVRSRSRSTDVNHTRRSSKPKSPSYLLNTLPLDLQSIITNEQEDLSKIIDARFSEKDFEWLLGIRTQIVITRIGNSNYVASNGYGDARILCQSIYVKQSLRGLIDVEILHAEYKKDNIKYSYIYDEYDTINFFYENIESANEAGYVRKFEYESHYRLLDVKSVFFLYRKRVRESGYQLLCSSLKKRH